MAASTIGFAVNDADRRRLDRLTKVYGGGNRSAFLRVALDQMEALERAERLRTLQQYGAEKSAAKAISSGDVEQIVKRVVSKRRRGSHPRSAARR